MAEHTENPPADDSADPETAADLSSRARDEAREARRQVLDAFLRLRAHGIVWTDDEQRFRRDGVDDGAAGSPPG